MVTISRGSHHMSMCPSIRSLWLAEKVDKDPATGKVTVTGLFNQIEAGVVPNLFDNPTCLFFSLTGVHNRVRLRLCYTDLRTRGVLIDRGLSVEGEPLDVIDVLIPVPHMPIPHSGFYAWELFHDGSILGSARIEAKVS